MAAPPWTRLFRRIRYGEPIVVVSGLPRSGTSMAMKMIEAGGINTVTDNKRLADEDNPKGYYEDERVMNLAQMEDKGWLVDARGKAIKVISYLLRELPGHYNYRVLFMHRHIDEVLASQAKMLTRRGEDDGPQDDKMRQIFEADVWRSKYLLRRSSHFEWLEVGYSEVLAEPMRQAERMNEFLGNSLDVQRMAEVVDPDLYRNRAG